MASPNDEKRRAAKIVAILRRDYADAQCALRHENAFQLLIATILSAQCTDARVNIVTEQLFKDYPTAADMAAAPLADIEKAIQSTGFFRNKAKNIKGCCEQLVAKYNGEVPQDMQALVQLPGVGRKTANVVLGTAYGIASGVVVDTHVGRISHRLGLTKANSAEKMEEDLMALLPKKEWINYSHRLIHHGRQVCKALKPRCEACSLNDLCPRIGVVRP